ncbi:Hint domain-containing protein [Frigidibacter mobilis]|uniref:Hedgehog/Intein (Hint) domain-containing protein n=1 Tax=Frigidibacter mobilis TaxID=1335048 RepID=A0A159Z4F1_9RHOB|nr:Hint domain-containing protein [Frigidibacter mobilis]AMY70045.1 hypothetical protein AKL17_2807 [Frigidibacter mobilis]
MALTFKALYVGNSATQLDPVEGNDTAEGGNDFAKATFGAKGNALAGNWVSFTSVDRGGYADILDMNNSKSNDQAIIDNGSGPVTYTMDGTAIFLGYITYNDGTVSAKDLPFVLVQMSNGDLYIMPSKQAGTDTNAALSAKQIQSITFTSIVDVNYSGMQADRSVINFVTCYAAGTLIGTPTGPRAIETLVPGDMVNTLDHGPQPIRWIGRHQLGVMDMIANPALQPVRIGAGAMGQGLPLRELLVSPQHRMLVRSPIAQRMFGGAEVMVAAKHLAGLPGIEPCTGAAPVEYWHILCDRHEVLFAEGAPSESLYTGEQALYALDPEGRAEIAALFPDMAPPEPARDLVPGRRARTLARRHAEGKRELLAQA